MEQRPYIGLAKYPVGRPGIWLVSIKAIIKYCTTLHYPVKYYC